MGARSSVSTLAWIGLGLVLVGVVAVVIGIAGFPDEGSF